MKPRTPRRFAFAILAAVFVVGAIPFALADVDPPGDVRTEITADALLNGNDVVEQPVHNAWFMPVGEVEPAPHTFSGMLVIPETEMLGFGNDEVPAPHPLPSQSRRGKTDFLV